MSIYLIKTFATYIIDADSDAEAYEIFSNCSWDVNDLTDEQSLEMLRYDPKTQSYIDMLREDI